MSTKVEKPTLAGVNVKTRKRNIVVPSDPGSFADAVITLFQDAYTEGATVEANLEAGAKELDAAELDFSRYGETLFEVLFAGGRLATGGNLAEDSGNKLITHLLAGEAEREAITPYILLFQKLIRRRPFLVRSLEQTLVKLALTLEFYDEAGKRKIAMATAMAFAHKLGILPENMFMTLLNDRLVAKGTILEFATTFFKEFLAKDSVDDLVAILSKGKVATRLVDFFPPAKRSPAAMAAHFKEAGLASLNDWNERRQIDASLKELENALTAAITDDIEPASAGALLELIKARRGEEGKALPDADVLRCLWTSLMRGINLTGKNNQQIQQSIIGMLKTYRKALAPFSSGGKAELALLVAVQVQCYEDNRLLKVFVDIVKLLYNSELVGEDTILHWYKKGSHPKGRNVFLKDIEPFIKWLEEAEEDEEEGDEA